MSEEMSEKREPIQERVKKHFSFKLIHKDKHSNARAGVITTPHGEIPTPIFMPVGTHGAIKAQAPKELQEMGIPILLSNTYHLYLTPGHDLVRKAGGLHKFMGWPNAILTDSGGFQVFSLKNKKITEEGVSFKGPQGENVNLGPEKAMQIQEALGSDIMMAFDECIPHPTTVAYAKNSIDRTHRWLDRCTKAWSREQSALFGIIQGSVFPELRRECVEKVTAFDLPGYAIGGVSVGEGTELMEKIVSFTAPLMPVNKPRYVMGVGNPEDLLMLWEHGVDMSDCIIPTKLARSGAIFTSRGKIRITHRKYRHDMYPLDKSCDCYVCKTFSRSYIKHLFDANEVLGAILATTHNIAYYYKLSQLARKAILDDKFLDFKKDFLINYKSTTTTNDVNDD